MTHAIPNIISKPPAHKEVQFLEDRLYEYNAAEINKNDGELFSNLIYDSQNAIIAGITGWTWAGACEITQLWVKYDYRNKGFGKNLLMAAEAIAKKKNCKTVILRTYSFQSPKFYLKYGYQVEFETKNFPYGHSYFCLVKQLTE